MVLINQIAFFLFCILFVFIFSFSFVSSLSSFFFSVNFFVSTLDERLSFLSYFLFIDLRERNISWLFHSLMHSLVVSWISIDQRLNPQPSHTGQRSNQLSYPAGARPAIFNQCTVVHWCATRIFKTYDT